MSFQRIIMAIFFLQPIVFGSWLPRIPDVQTRLGLGPADLALALLGLPVGILATLPFAGRLVSRVGGRAAIIYGFVVFLAVVSLPAFADSVGALFAGLVIVGAALSTLELGLNIEADRAERTMGSVIMSRCHGFWSLGIMVGSLVGGILASLHVPPHWSILGAAIVVLPMALLISVQLPPDVKTGKAHEEKRRTAFRPPSWALLGICIFTFGITMTEGAIADWSAVYLRDVFQAQGIGTGIGYTIFACMVAAGRFAGDTMKTRYGVVLTARICGCSALAGMLVVLLAANSHLALVGFGAVGLGVSVGFPLAVTASAGLTDRPAAASVAILSFVALLGFLVGAPMIGFVAEFWGLRVGLAMLMPPLLLSLAFTRMLASKPQIRLAGVPGRETA